MLCDLLVAEERAPTCPRCLGPGEVDKGVERPARDAQWDGR